MSIERTYHCDGPDCLTHGRTISDGTPYDFILVVQGRGGKERHFCTWDCVLRYAAAKEPKEVVGGIRS